MKSTVPAPIITWSVDTPGLEIPATPTPCTTTSFPMPTDGAIVLLHDLYSTSVQGVLRAMDTLKSQGYEFVTVSELFRPPGASPRKNGKVYSSAPNKGVNLPAYRAPSISSAADAAGGPGHPSLRRKTCPCTTPRTAPCPTWAANGTPGPLTITKDTTFTVVGIDQFGTRTQTVCQTVAGMPQASAPPNSPLKAGGSS